MTENLARARKSILANATAGSLCLGFLSLFCLALFLRNPNVAISYMNRGMQICVRTVIPSLFPFMVISEAILSSGIGALLIRPISPLLQKLFRLSETGACALLLGMLCGFPIGAKCTAIALDRGQIDREEAARLLAFSNSPSSAFLISAVGISLWKSRQIGVALLLTVLITQLLTGLLLAGLPNKRKKTEPPLPLFEQGKARPLGTSLSCFTDAVKSSALGMLTVCAYVIFFSTLSGALGLILDGLGASTVLKASTFCFLELSGGMSAASAIPNAKTALLLSAFCAGWSGLSVHCQILSVCDGRGLRWRSYFLAKLLQGGVCAGIFAVFLACFPSLLQTVGSTAQATFSASHPIPFLTFLFLLSLLPIAWSRLKRKSPPANG